MQPWWQTLLSVITGGVIVSAANYFIYFFNKRKEDRRLHIATVGKFSGVLNKLMNIEYRILESRIWLVYTFIGKQKGWKTLLDVPTAMNQERSILREFDDIKSDFEIVLSEYLGYKGNSDEEFVKLIIDYRSCTLPDQESMPDFKSELEYVNFLPAKFVGTSHTKNTERADSYYLVCRKLSVHIRTLMAPF